MLLKFVYVCELNCRMEPMSRQPMVYLPRQLNPCSHSLPSPNHWNDLLLTTRMLRA